MKKTIAIVGCGDVGSRIAQRLCKLGHAPYNLIPIVRSKQSLQKIATDYENALTIDLDNVVEMSCNELAQVDQLYYLVPPQKSGDTDLRTQQFLAMLERSAKELSRIVLISTTGVYGDCQGGQVTEETPLNPTTPRSQRRADMERQWQKFAQDNHCLLSVLRVPGIYSHSRLPRKRLEAQAPIVDPNECGFTNRIHADDLAMICEQVMIQQTKTDVYNATDGHPGKMSQYFLDVAEYLNISTPEVMSFAEAESLVTSEMMSYLRESRKISNKKLLEAFNLKLKYEDYREGICF